MNLNERLEIDDPETFKIIFNPKQSTTKNTDKHRFQRFCQRKLYFVAGRRGYSLNGRSYTVFVYMFYQK